MLVLGRQASGVALHAGQVDDPELGAEELDHGPGHLHRLGEEGAQEPGGAQLQGEAEPVGVTAALGHKATVSVVEDEVPLQLFLGRRASEPPERRRLLVGEELHAHPHTQAQARVRVLGLAFNPAPLLLTPPSPPSRRPPRQRLA